INADIMYALRKYVGATGDEEFLFKYGAEMLIETARLWADLGFYGDGDERFHIHGVTGPDEYNTVVNDNTFTNLMARQNLRFAAETVERMSREHPRRYAALAKRTRFDPREIEAWRQAADRMYVPFDEAARIHPQDESFLEKEPWDFDGTPPEKYPLLLHFHPLSIYRHRVIKQADIVLAMFLLSREFSREQKKRNFDYYDPNKEWLFDWKKWENTLMNMKPQSLDGPGQSVLHRLDSADMRILRQLSLNARRKSRDIAEKAEVEPYHLSRRRKVMENLGVIQGYRVLAGMHLLQLTSHAIINCKCSIDTTYRVAAAVKMLPFQSTFIQTLQGFVLYTTTTAIDFPILATILLEQCDSAEISWCDYRSSFRYWFYDEPFKDGAWKADHNYMVDTVISKLEENR
ncbi:MAG: hypothetical protein V3S09_00580, partial [Candidatus Bathyarchaeia archaeon]